jgi:hypothetical protein
MKDDRGHGSNVRNPQGGLSEAARDRVIRGKMLDQSHMPVTTVGDRMAAMALGQGHPKSYVAPLGSSFAQAQDQLDRARNLALPHGTPGRRKS